jgi:hypothetical protein
LEATVNRRGRKRLDVLRRRAEHLENRLADYRGRNPSYTEAELVALRYVIGLVEQAEAEDLIGFLESRLPREVLAGERT